MTDIGVNGRRSKWWDKDKGKERIKKIEEERSIEVQISKNRRYEKMEEWRRHFINQKVNRNVEKAKMEENKTTGEVERQIRKLKKKQ